MTKALQVQGYSDAGDREPPGLDMKDQMQFRDVIVKGEGNALTFDLESTFELGPAE